MVSKKVKLLALDSCVVIDALDVSSAHHAEAKLIVDDAQKLGSDHKLVGSWLLLAEVLGVDGVMDPTTEALIEKFLHGQGIGMRNADAFTARIARSLRQAHKKICATDAMHLATAIHCGAEAFLTRDGDRKKRKVKLLGLSGKVQYGDSEPLTIITPGDWIQAKKDAEFPLGQDKGSVSSKELGLH